MRAHTHTHVYIGRSIQMPAPRPYTLALLLGSLARLAALAPGRAHNAKVFWVLHFRSGTSSSSARSGIDIAAEHFGKDTPLAMAFGKGSSSRWRWRLVIDGLFLPNRWLSDLGTAGIPDWVQGEIERDAQNTQSQPDLLLPARCPPSYMSFDSARAASSNERDAANTSSMTSVSIDDSKTRHRDCSCFLLLSPLSSPSAERGRSVVRV